MFLSEPYVSLLCVRWKKYFFDHFQTFFIVFDHAHEFAGQNTQHMFYKFFVFWYKKFYVETARKYSKGWVYYCCTFKLRFSAAEATQN